jgi:hypothetical protein
VWASTIEATQKGTIRKESIRVSVSAAVVHLKQAADRVGVHPKTMERWARLRLVVAFRHGPRGHWHVLVDELGFPRRREPEPREQTA